MANQGSQETCNNNIGNFEVLPEGCIADALSHTTPLDACRMSLVASNFRLIVDSDAVWERFLPSDYRELIARAVQTHGQVHDLLDFSSKKKLYLHLSDHPCVIDGGSMSFSLDKWTGKKCFMVAARELAIVWGDTPRYWRWTSDSESRFRKVIELISVCWLEIHGKINTSLLSPDTVYKTYLVYKPSEMVYGFDDQPIEISVGLIGEESTTRTVYLDPVGGIHRRDVPAPRLMGLLHNFRSDNQERPRMHVPADADRRYPRARKDGWLEIELAEYFHNAGENRELEVTMMEVKGGHWKSGLIIQGLEIQPKATN